MSDTGPTVFNGRYELHRRLGRGGMAEVFLARDQLLDRPVAIKVLFPEFATDPAFVERFRREATAAANLNHPNIVGVYDWGEAEGTYFIVMEYVDGRSLSEILRADGPLHPDRAADIGADVAAALGFAHRNGVVHRDVKPGNVLVDQSGQVKVADFGIARAITASSDDNLTQAGTVMGTATYFSPEQARGDAVDPRSDIYSLGCVLYELVVGRPPFSGDSPVAIAYKQVHESPVPPRQINPAVPPALEAIILKCLAKNPVNRYPSAEDLRADLRRFREGNRILAEPVMAPPADARATGVLAATTVVAAAGGGGSGTRADRSTRTTTTTTSRAAPPARSSPCSSCCSSCSPGCSSCWPGRSASARTTTRRTRSITVPNVDGEQLEDADAPRSRRSASRSARPPRRTTTSTRASCSTRTRPRGEGRGGQHRRAQGQRGGETVPVPDVIGSSQEEATTILTEAGFEVQVSPAPTRTRAGRGRQPGARTRRGRPRGSTVELFVSSGPGDVAIRDVTGRTEAEASEPARPGRLPGRQRHESRRTASPRAASSAPIRRRDRAGRGLHGHARRVLGTVEHRRAERDRPVRGRRHPGARRTRASRWTSSRRRSSTRQDGRVLDQDPNGGTEHPDGHRRHDHRRVV